MSVGRVPLNTHPLCEFNRNTLVEIPPRVGEHTLHAIRADHDYTGCTGLQARYVLEIVVPCAVIDEKKANPHEDVDVTAPCQVGLG